MAPHMLSWIHWMDDDTVFVHLPVYKSKKFIGKRAGQTDKSTCTNKKKSDNDQTE